MSSTKGHGQSPSKPAEAKSTSKPPAGESRSRELRGAVIGLVGAVLGAAIVFLATVSASSSASTANEARQIRELKLAQYALAYEAIDAESRSISNVVGALKAGDVSAATSEVKSYQGAESLQTRLASLPLVAGGDVLGTSIAFLKARQDFISELLRVTAKIDGNSRPSQQAMETLANLLELMDSARINILAAMRIDLNIP